MLFLDFFFVGFLFILGRKREDFFMGKLIYLREKIYRFGGFFSIIF